MSSLAASRSDNFYFPPEWTPEMGGISKFQGSKGANQYQTHGIIRFELPFDAWCLGCNLHMSKGLRFNAKKDKAGKYFSTTIWSFSMKCNSCQQPFLILTDPQNKTYDFKEGLRKHEQDYIPTIEDGLIDISGDSRQQIQKDAMNKLEHNQEDLQKAKTTHQRLQELQELQHKESFQDFNMNSLMRKKNREKKRDVKRKLDEGQKVGLSFELQDSTSDDLKIANSIEFKKQKIDNFNLSEQKKKLAISTSKLFKQKDQKLSKRDTLIQKISNKRLNLSTVISSDQSNRPLVKLTQSIQNPIIKEDHNNGNSILNLISEYGENDL